MDINTLSLADVTKFTDEQARQYLEAIRWPKGADCAHCGSPKVTKLGGQAARTGLYKCRDCRKKFTVMVGTIFEDSHIPLRSWVIAFHLMCSSKKGFSAMQLQRNLGLKSYKSAWHMAHRIRHAMKEEGFADLLQDAVEVDETYVGGKLRAGPHANHPGERPQDRPAVMANKSPVVALVERNGRVRSMHVANVTAANLKEIIRKNVEPSAHVMTDEAGVYDFVGKEFARHSTVNHRNRGYSRLEADGTLASTNTVEGYFSILKRGVYGTFHNLSKQHLHRYLSEFDFRYNARKIEDGERAALAIQGAEGKRLMYK
ncbi:MAG: IS1595 family transposase [Terriglobia bacterium]